MSDEVVEQAQSDAVSPPVTALRQAREQAGLHVVALAAMLKVPVQRLEALEAGRYQDLPDLTFARALASSVCRVLKIDPAPVLASLPASAAVRLGTPEGALNAPMPTRHAPLLAGAAVPNERRLPLPAAVAVLVLVVAVVLWFFLPPRAEVPATAPAETPAAAVAPAVAVEPVPVAAPVSVPVAPALPVVPAPVAAPVTPVPAVPVPVESPAAPAPVAADSVLQMQARGASWVQVTGASGRVLLQRGLQAGEQVSFSADLPLTVVVGRADETQVTVRGAPFDLVPYTRNNVARFEVK
ncbi:helix-turn-helix domain-containing protein [Macromonas nakdongensis]|uniref:helix-turn-helix domain-containing protein n=1 Tax=Macromonas nakdongensis TaxID=1843082 RepID=UPI000C337268|nr:helix-turn-helix domain-containing protein [Macromonas nakdongensis]